MTGKIRVRGFVWVLVGVGLLVANYVGLPLRLRGTDFPFWIVIAGLGVVLIVWDSMKARKEKEDLPPGPP